MTGFCQNYVYLMSSNLKIGIIFCVIIKISIKTYNIFLHESDKTHYKNQGTLIKLIINV